VAQFKLFGKKFIYDWFFISRGPRLETREPWSWRVGSILDQADSLIRVPCNETRAPSQIGN